ncbi:potassium channel subfamily K member 12 [Hypomesus transpacificus]|uniref:potassium channel subfamily K member 12 n=1 Tax=Hypomesus transpacificus TaxID=137520 RepID=UPI001F080F09|nr:potassium channel subfamily K member 12 [Hypomesus transpacificus]
MPVQRLPGCRGLHINEDNGRFLLLAVLIILYLLCGAAVFSAIERPSELRAHGRWNRALYNFSDTFNISLAELKSFLRQYEAAIAAGIRADVLRPRWDFTGAFYFVGTVVSTIGYGMTTPVTAAGKVFLIFYGLLGCAATILFFNLFLERIITLLAVAMKAVRERRIRTSGLVPPGIQHDFSSYSLPGWKPSVYHVMLILALSAILISCCGSAMYAAVEGWAFLDSLYFCFVTFSTIGFGDLVSSQRNVYEQQTLYRLANFLFILTGVCCLYSLFNVISIVIKQVLNWLLERAGLLCCQRCHKTNVFLGRRNAIRPGSRSRRGRFGRQECPDAPPSDSDTEGRRLSGEMISMKDLTASNKVSLAIMQKQLSDSANGFPACGGSRHNGFSGGVGALGIMNNRLAETSNSR